MAIGVEDCLYFADWLTLASACDSLRTRLGFGSRRLFHSATSTFDQLRNDLAHGGTILDSASADLDRALDRVRRVQAFAENVWNEVARGSNLWDAYAATAIRSPRARRPIAGPHATRGLPSPGPLFVITAWNPGSVRRPVEANHEANQELSRLLRRHGHEPQIVVGNSPDGKWHEESLLVSGMRRERAAEIGEMFGQVAVFELTDDELGTSRGVV